MPLKPSRRRNESDSSGGESKSNENEKEKKKEKKKEKEKDEKKIIAESSHPYSACFPPYHVPPMVEITVKVSYTIGTAASREQRIRLLRELGVESAVNKCKNEIRGLRKDYDYRLHSNDGEITDGVLLSMTDNSQLQLKQYVELLADPVAESRGKKKTDTKVAKKVLSSALSISLARKLRWENGIKLACEDVEKMTFAPSENKKFSISLFPSFGLQMSNVAYFTFWAAHVINSIEKRYRDKTDVDNKEVVDCLISLERTLNECRPICPPSLIIDSEHNYKRCLGKCRI